MVSHTLDEVINENIGRLRRSRQISQEGLASRLTDALERDYTRFTVADMEGARDRDRSIRWVELVALCGIFDVPLWELVLPDDNQLVRMRVPVSSDVTVTSKIAKFDGIEVASTVHMDENRDSLAMRLFALTSYEIDSKQMQKKWDEREPDRSRAKLAVANAILPLFDRFLEDLQREGS